VRSYKTAIVKDATFTGDESRLSTVVYATADQRVWCHLGWYIYQLLWKQMIPGAAQTVRPVRSWL